MYCSVFQNLVILFTNLVAYVIPDMPRKLREQVHREAYLTNEIILKTELEKAHGMDGVLSPQQLEDIRRRAKSNLDSTPSNLRKRHVSGGNSLGNGTEPESVV